jgi:tRNA threonylcarbamoyladenosine biosynthesis protein TsaE
LQPAILGTRLAHWPDEAACAASAAALAAHPALADAYIELSGPLGAGKTTFARHLLAALGVDGRVKSPTYTLMEPYRSAPGHGGFPIAHFDFYRFDDPQEWEDAGFRDVFAEPGLKLVEWPDKAAGLLPRADLRLHIAPHAHDAARELRVEALSPRGEELLA